MGNETSKICEPKQADVVFKRKCMTVRQRDVGGHTTFGIKESFTTAPPSKTTISCLQLADASAGNRGFRLDVEQQSSVTQGRNEAPLARRINIGFPQRLEQFSRGRAGLGSPIPDFGGLGPLHVFEGPEMFVNVAVVNVIDTTGPRHLAHTLILSPNLILSDFQFPTMKHRQDLSFALLSIGVESKTPELGQHDGAELLGCAVNEGSGSDNGHDHSVVDPSSVDAINECAARDAREDRIVLNANGKSEPGTNNLGLHGAQKQPEHHRKRKVGEASAGAEANLGVGWLWKATHLPPRPFEHPGNERFQVLRGSSLLESGHLAKLDDEVCDKLRSNAKGSHKPRNLLVTSTSGEEQRTDRAVECATNIDEKEHTRQTTSVEQVYETFDRMRGKIDTDFGAPATLR